ncbi:response regulator [Trichloromonas sp.]|uniref:response regulator n=1 Tax=Trichloromonas sp. TaxID=3069249 RepID=UPI003D8135D0
MDKIVEWLCQVEEKAAESYRRASGGFADDPTFSQFLNALAEEEMRHAQMLRAAFAGRGLLKVEEIATTIDGETRQVVVSALDGAMQKIAAGGVSREEMAALIADIEFSEWNGIFLYAMNVLKGSSPEYRSALAEIENHLKGIEEYLSTFPYGRQVLEKIQRLPSLGALRVLVVEDDPALAFLVKNVLLGQARVEIASNGQEGLKRLEEGVFDVIVVDVEMPVMNGVEMYQEAIRLDSRLKERFVFLTASHKPEVRNFIAEQRLPVLRKPAPISQIRQAVVGVSARRRISA